MAITLAAVVEAQFVSVPEHHVTGLEFCAALVATVCIAARISILAIYSGVSVVRVFETASSAD
jgi:hypothetical protein